MFDAIEVMAARTGNHKRAAVRMSRLAVQASIPAQVSPDDIMSRAEAHMRAGEQWLLADEPAEAVAEFRAAMADAGPTFDDPRVSLARAMFALDRPAEADALLAELTGSGARLLPRTCDLVAELLTEQGDLPARWTGPPPASTPACGARTATSSSCCCGCATGSGSTSACAEDEYDKLLDEKKAGPAAGS